MIKLAAVASLLGITVPMGVFAAAGEDGLPPWVNYGVLGLLVLSIALKQFVPGWLYADVKNENIELRAENRRLVDLNLETQSAVGPALASATKLIEEMSAEMRIMRRQGGS